MSSIESVCSAGNLEEIDNFITCDKINLYDQKGLQFKLQFFFKLTTVLSGINYVLLGFAPIHYVCQRDTYDVPSIIELLVSKGCNINLTTKDRRDNALQLAIRSDSFMQHVIDVSVVLLKLGLDSSSRNNQLRSAFDEAIDANYPPLIEVLCGSKTIEELEIDNKLHRDEYYCNLLIEHIKKGKNEARLYDILRRKFALDTRDKENDTPLNLSIKLESLRKDNIMLKLVEFFLKSGADPSLIDIDDHDAYYLADVKKYRDVQRLLHKFKNSKEPEIVECEPLQSADLESPSETPSESPPLNGLEKLNEALFDAIAFGELSEVEECLKTEANLQEKTDEGYGVFHLVCIREDERDRTEICKALLKAGAPVDIIDEKKESPLFEAARKNLDEIAHLILTQSNSYAATNKDGFTAKDIATEKNSEETLKVFENYEKRKRALKNWKKASDKAKTCFIL
ncbi:DgyrCDS1931 [Dimorphilus gyrociliatus]|uniref:DgyrCDS1931 n=1 Tax=Dimorphilus gyrociliatus TaxID=2664684 RepID=A0A7I8V8S8_9ANNE|nr:DgyrCDS1931 [Dimorphilus gyrociliatus]